MATSGTVLFDLDFGDIIEEAYERAGVSMRGGYGVKSARRSLSLILMEWGNRGLNMWTQEELSIPLVSGTHTYNLPSGTIDVLEAIIRRNNSDYTLTRISMPTYSSIPNKTSTGQPSQYFITRDRDTPTITLYPGPGTTLNGESLVYWRLRQMEDIGGMDANQDIPRRFLPALVSGLAYEVALKNPEATKRVPMLKVDYEEKFTKAAEEDRERSAWSITPAWDDYR
jgi:hypothetical protein